MNQPEVKVIEANKKKLLIEEMNMCISVCAYCRVSTDKQDQSNSYEAQQRHFGRLFNEHSNWTERDIFADKGISGTSLKNRDEFNKMIELARSGKYQIIITKEVSRFSRNIQDLLNLVTDLREKGVYILFLTDEINTEKADYREKLIEAGKSAEMESSRISKRVRWGHQRQMENGIVFGRSRIYGYVIERDVMGKQTFTIIEEEAKIIKMIFNLYADGWGKSKIAQHLNGLLIPTPHHKGFWTNSQIDTILHNEKYVGDLITGKTFTPDFLTHESKKNNGESIKVQIENHHSDKRIISREQWNLVQELLSQQHDLVAQGVRHSSRYWCSGIIICGECGKTYTSQIHKRGALTYKSWKCISAVQHGHKKEVVDSDSGQCVTYGCNSRSISDFVLKEGIRSLLMLLCGESFNDIWNILCKQIEKGITRNDNALSDKIQTLTNEISQIEATISFFIKFKCSSPLEEGLLASAKAEKEEEIRKKQLQLAKMRKEKSENCHQSTLQKRIEAIKAAIELRDDSSTDYIYRSIISKIVVGSNNTIQFYLKEVDAPFVMRYQLNGKAATRNVTFTFIDDSQSND